MTQNTSSAVMARRVEPHHSLDHFPTPPWATRALVKHVLPAIGYAPPFGAVTDPCCGQGHMAQVLRETAREVRAYDIFDYGYPRQDDTRDFLFGEGWVTDWYIFNPPFKIASQFVLHALHHARIGVAALCRTQWIEGVERYEELFKPFPETVFAPFVERVPMISGRWDPDASTATGYAWFVWLKVGGPLGQRIIRIPPGAALGLTRPDDRRRFAAWSVTPPDLDRVEAIARELCIQEHGPDSCDAVAKTSAHNTMTYPEWRVFTEDRVGVGDSTVPRWMTFRRRADDIVAAELTAKALAA